MRLADLAAEARLRAPWEGVDLGFVLAREWYPRLLGLYVATLLPCAAAGLLIFGPHSVWATFVVWWLKPVYEAPLLVWLSRRMFGETMTWAEIRAAITPTGRRDLFAWLTWARLSPSRSFLMPVGLLESLSGAPKRERIAVLRFGASNAAWFTIACAHFELVIDLSLLAFAWLLVPAAQQMTLAGLLAGDHALLDWVTMAAYLVTLMVVAPFYVAGGFALYLTRRSELEAWDLEIRLRRLVERRTERGRRGAAALAFLLALCGPAVPQPAQAAPVMVTRQAAQDAAARVLKREVFGKIETHGHWVYVGRKPPPGTTDPGWRHFIAALRDLLPALAGLLRVLAWLAATALAVWLMTRLQGHMQWLRGPQGRRRAAKTAAPAGILGLPTTGDPPPADVPGAARRLLAAGEIRASLAVLLRATLVRLGARYGIAFGEHLTEQECAALLAAPPTPAEAAYFSALLDLWIRHAYAHETPSPESLQAIVEAYEDPHAPPAAA